MSEWLGIETAPKDGTGILVWGAAFGEQRIVSWNEPDNGWESDEGTHPALAFSHWMPLPAPPA